MIPALHCDEGRTVRVPFTAGSDRTAGDAIVKNEKLGVVREDVSSGNDGVMYTGVPPAGIDMPKKTGESFSHLDEVYWDATAGAFTGTAADGVHVGYAYLSSGAPGGQNADTEVRVVLQDSINNAVT